ncbi:MAG: tetratricopeptide repeat protein [Myxococcales bacterium]|nr:tetratricopeptide repeat protein [Myxococcales bacterium]
MARALRVDAATARLRAGQPDAAVRLLEDALEDAPADAGALEQLARIHREAGRWRAYVTTAHQSASAIRDAERRAHLLTHLARVTLERLEDPSLAEELLASAVEADPGDALAWQMLVDCLRRRGAHAEAARGLERLVAATEDAAGQVDGLWALATLRLDAMEDEAGAVAALERLLQVEPTWQPALELLGRLLTRRGDWAALVAMHRAELESLGDPRQRANQYYKIGELFELHLHDVAAAAEAYREAVELDPDFVHGARALARMLLAQGDHAGYVALLRQEVDRSLDGRERVRLYERIAEVCADHLDDVDGAVEAWRAVLAVQPAHAEAVRAIARLCARSGRWAELLEMNERELEHTEQPQARLALLVRSAEVSLRHLDDPARARAYLDEALAIDPRFLPALQAMGRLCQAAGDWTALLEMYRREAALLGSGPEAAALHFRIGEVLRDQVGDRAEAQRAFRTCLELDEGQLAAVRALRDLALATGDRARAAELMASEAEQLTEPRERARLLHRLGALYAEAGEVDAAVDAWQRALAAEATFRPALAALLEVYRERGDHEALATTHRRLADAAGSTAEAVEHWLEVGRIATESLGLPAAAIEAYETVLTLVPDHVDALLALERLYLGARDPGELVRVYDGLARATRAPAARVEALLQRARVHEAHLDDAPAALADYLEALDVQPLQAEALEWVEAWASETGDVDLLASVLERRLQVCRDGREQNAVLLRAGALLREAGRLREASECYRAVIDSDGGSPIALRALREIHADLGDADEVVALAEREGRLSQHPANASALLVEAARSREAVKWPGQEALDDYLTALERNPEDEEAAAGVRRVCERTGRWAALVDAFERRADALTDQRPALLEEVAELCVSRLDDPRRAVTLLQRAVDGTPGDADAELLQRLADLYAEIEDWPAAARAYAALRTASPDPSLRRAVTFRLWAIHREKAPDRAAARAVIEAYLDEVPEDVAALERLATTALEARDADAARDALTRALAVVDEPLDEARLAELLADVEKAAHHADAEMAALERALAAAPPSTSLLVKLADACGRARRPKRLRAVLEGALEGVRSEEDRVRLLKRRAALTREAGGELSDATDDLEAVVALAPDDVAARRWLIELLGRQPRRQAAAVPHLQALLVEAPLDVGLLRSLRAAWAATGEVEAAVEVAGLLAALDAGEDADATLLRAHARTYRGAPEGALPPDVRAALWGEDPAAGLADLVSTLALGLPGLFGAGGGHRARSVGLEDHAGRAAAWLGWPEVELQFEDRPCGEVRRIDRAVVFSDELAVLPSAEQAFVLGYGLELARRGLDAVTRWSPGALRALLQAVCAAAGFAVEDVEDRATLEARAASLQTRLGRRMAAHRETIGRLADALTRRDLGAAHAGWRARAARVGLTLAGNVLPAVRALRRVAADTGGEAAALAPVARWLVTDASGRAARRAARPGDAPRG